MSVPTFLTTMTAAGPETESAAPDTTYATVLFVLNKICPPIIVALGLVGNTLAILVLTQPRYAKQTTCYYMRILAVFDSSCLLGHVTVRTIIQYHTKVMFSLQGGPIVCPLMNYLVSAYGLSNWTIAAMTLDRLIAVKYPLQAASWCTLKRCKVMVGCIIVIYLAMAIPFGVRRFNPTALVLTDICQHDPTVFPKWMITLWYPLHTVVLFTLPFFIILILNITIVVTLAKDRMAKKNQKIGQTHQATSQDGHITVLLFSVTVIFFVTNIPWTVDYWLWEYLLSHPDMTESIRIIRKLSYEALVFGLFINPAVNFYIYCLSCRKFREDTIAIIRKSFIRRPQIQ